MTTRSLYDKIKVARGISPAAAGTDNTAFVSQIIDMQGYGAAMFALLTGALTDTNATFAITVDVGDASNLSDAAAYTPPQGSTSFTFAADDSVYKIPVVTDKRYARVTVTPSGNDSGNIFLAGAWILGMASQAPVG